MNAPKKWHEAKQLFIIALIVLALVFPPHVAQAGWFSSIFSAVTDIVSSVVSVVANVVDSAASFVQDVGTDVLCGVGLRESGCGGGGGDNSGVATTDTGGGGGTPSGCGDGTLNDTCPPPVPSIPSGCGDGTLNDTCPPPVPVIPSGCGDGTLNDTCPPPIISQTIVPPSNECIGSGCDAPAAPVEDPWTAFVNFINNWITTHPADNNSRVSNSGAIPAGNNSGAPTDNGGTGGGNDTQESAPVPVYVPTPINGVCGSADNSTYFRLPNPQITPYLFCQIGTRSQHNFSVVGPWNWSCQGWDGGRTASCHANYSCGNGVCDKDKGEKFTTCPADCHYTIFEF